MAVHGTKQQARRTCCRNNFRQVVIGLHNHHDVHGRFPHGMNATTTQCGFPRTFFGYGWSTSILPFIEQQNVQDKFDFKRQTTESPNDVAGTVVLETFLCPTDSKSDDLVHAHNAGAIQFGRTNMAGVADSRDWTCNTLIIGEITGNPNSSVSARNWVSFNLADTANGINGPYSGPGDGNWDSDGAGFSSYHADGCHFALCDGSVQFLRENIDPTALRYLTERSDGKPIPGF